MLQKTKFTSFNQKEEPNNITNDSTHLEEVEDFKYLGAWMQSTEKDIKTRKAADQFSISTGVST